MLTQAQVDSVQALLREGLTDREVAKRAGVGRTTVQRIWNGLLNKKPPKKPYQPIPQTASYYERVRREAIAAMEDKLARKRATLAMQRDR